MKLLAICTLAENFSQDVRFFDTRQFEIQTLEPIRKLTMVDAEQVQHGRMQVTDVHGFFDGVVSQFVRRSVAATRSYSTTCQPDGKALDVVIASRSFAFILHHRCPTELTSPHDKCFVEHPALLEISDQRIAGSIGMACAFNDIPL